MKGFTQVELVFVIVIIGVLAAVAIPKLSATRDDSKKSTLLANTKICINDAISSYKGQDSIPDLSTIHACTKAQSEGASIEFDGDYLKVSNVDITINGLYIYKGTRVNY